MGTPQPTPPVDSGRLLLRVAECAVLLSVSRSAAYRLVATGALRSVRLPGAGGMGSLRVLREDLIMFVESLKGSGDLT